MNLVIDIGNTRTKYGVFEQGQLKTVKTEVAAPQDGELLPALLAQQPAYISVASVHHPSASLIEKLQAVADTLVIDHHTPLPIRTAYTTPSTLGIDRVCAAVAGHLQYPNHPVLVIDMGTCITYDVVTSEGEHIGGGISPGYSMRLHAMHQLTARLPFVDASLPPPHLGTDTKGSMLFGAFEGTAAELNGIIQLFQHQFADLKVILTGGDQSKFEQRVENPIFAAQNLVLEGIHAILQHNINAE